MANYKTLSYEQPGAVFYSCVMRAKDVVDRLEVKRRSSDPNAGVQRDENEGRVREIANYLRKPDAIVPTPIIVSADERLVRVVGDELVVEDGPAVIGHILDGQHRVLGLRSLEQSLLERINVLVVFVFQIDAFSEATIFTTINSNQKQVSKSLIYDLFGLNPNRSPEKTGHEIAKSLNDDPESPFFQRIKLLGSKVQESETLSQAAFIDRLLEALNTKGSNLRPYFERDEDWAIRKVISNAFEGLQAALQDVPNDYPPDFFLKTTGFGGVLKSINRIADFGRTRSTLSPLLFKEVFSAFLQRAPAPVPGTGNSAMLNIRGEIERAVEHLEAQGG